MEPETKQKLDEQSQAETNDSAVQSGQGEQSFYKAVTSETYVGSDLEENSTAPEVRTGLSISWQASEYIHHDKGTSWFVVLWIFAAALAGLAIFLGWYIFAGLVIVMAFALGVYAKRQPHELQYTADDDGIKIGDKPYPFNEFRAFGISQDAGISSIKLLPAKRLMPATVIYFAPEDGEKIVDIISSHLPIEEIKEDFVDKLSHKLRF